MKVLLIDDEADNGWKETIEKVLFNGDPIEVALDIDSAKRLLDTVRYDLIILDLRFGELDHQGTDIVKFGGYKILTEGIRSSIKKINFPTPVLLFTASNKVWNITEMMEAGADDYYIKEHPDVANDFDFSRKNYFRLKGDGKNRGIVKDLLELGEKRKEIFLKISEIITKSGSQIHNNNIRLRIEEKLKIGYGILFRKLTKTEKEKLLFNNEVIAYIIFWSILEEISKDSFVDNWIKNDEKEGSMHDDNWILKKNGKIFIEDFRFKNLGRIEGALIVGLTWDGHKYISRSRNIDDGERDIKFFTGKISLSTQIFALMLLGKEWDPNIANNLFAPLNAYRNEIDFIHSSVSTIFNNSLAENMNNPNAYKKCLEILEFINKLLD